LNLEADYKVLLDQLPNGDRSVAVAFLQNLASRNLSRRSMERYLEETVSFQKWLKKSLADSSADDLRQYIRFKWSQVEPPTASESQPSY